ncbi:hypothetical protein H0H92_010381 [Tricholoma furcatifolium]|nr:hypothetical protein H0H92_010381 [Tricholoma furcatifolium]
MTSMERVRDIVKNGDPATWDTAWQQHLTPWDAGQFQPPLRELVESSDVDLPRQGRALVPGCGSGYDVVYLASALSLDVIGMDVSETAIQKANSAVQVASPGSVSFQVGDFFRLKGEGQFDLIYDYTYETVPQFFVAIPPARRVEWAQQMASLVKPGGFLITLVWPIDAPTDLGPPFFVRVEHYENVLSDAFDKVLDKVPTMSLDHHVGKERIVVWKRKV